jgi:hypothetical protein
MAEDAQPRGIEPYHAYRQQVWGCHHPTACFMMLIWRSYTKQRLTVLHPNIMVQRSPSHFQSGTLYWAHVCCRTLFEIRSAYEALKHEKLCVIDSTIAFMGGLDLCFGRCVTPGSSFGCGRLCPDGIPRNMHSLMIQRKARSRFGQVKTEVQ